MSKNLFYENVPAIKYEVKVIQKLSADGNGVYYETSYNL